MADLASACRECIFVILVQERGHLLKEDSRSPARHWHRNPTGSGAPDQPGDDNHYASFARTVSDWWWRLACHPVVESLPTSQDKKKHGTGAWQRNADDAFQEDPACW